LPSNGTDVDVNRCWTTKKELIIVPDNHNSEREKQKTGKAKEFLLFN